MPTICIYPDNLLLDSVSLNKNNELSGYVVNGGWYYQEKNGKVYAKRTANCSIKRAVNSWGIKNKKVVFVVGETDAYYRYNEILDKYSTHVDQYDDLSDFIDMMIIEENNCCRKEYDDDICF